MKYTHFFKDPVDFNEAWQTFEDYVKADEPKRAEMLADDPSLAPIAKEVQKREAELARGLAMRGLQ